MKKILLEMEDKVFAELEQGLIAKGIVGALFGTQDAVIALLVKAIKAGNKEVSIIQKKKKKKRKRKKQ